MNTLLQKRPDRRIKDACLDPLNHLGIQDKLAFKTEKFFLWILMSIFQQKNKEGKTYGKQAWGYNKSS